MHTCEIRVDLDVWSAILVAFPETTQRLKSQGKVRKYNISSVYVWNKFYICCTKTKSKYRSSTI